MNNKLYGICFCLAIAIPSWLLVKFIPSLSVIGAPVIAILAGMLVTRCVKNNEKYKAGIAFTSKKVLQFAVVLLGFGLNLATVGRVGAQSLPVIVSTIGISLVVSYIMFRLLKVDRNSAILIGVGSSICGGSAVAATAPVIGADDEEIARAISVIFLFNVIAALIFPTLGEILGFSNDGFGLFAGTAINDTSSVTAAASTWDTLHGTGGKVLEYATIVKLTRTLAIIPITFVLGIYEAKRKKTEGNKNFSLKNAFPMFILYFALASVLTSLAEVFLGGQVLAFAESVFAFLKEVSKFCIVMAMAAIGLNTDIVKLIKTGAKPIVIGLTCWICIALMSLGMQHMLGMM